MLWCPFFCLADYELRIFCQIEVARMFIECPASSPSINSIVLLHLFRRSSANSTAFPPFYSFLILSCPGTQARVTLLHSSNWFSAQSYISCDVILVASSAFTHSLIVNENGYGFKTCRLLERLQFSMIGLNWFQFVV